MNKKDVNKCKKIASELDWDKLSYVIIKLERGFEGIKEFMSKQDKLDMLEMIEIYEDEKNKRVKEESTISIKYDMLYTDE